MENSNPILLFRNIGAEYDDVANSTYNINTGLHRFTEPENHQPVFTNSMQTKSREAIDTIEYSEN